MAAEKLRPLITWGHYLKTWTGCCPGCTCPDPHLSKPLESEPPVVNVEES